MPSFPTQDLQQNYGSFTYLPVEELNKISYKSNMKSNQQGSVTSIPKRVRIKEDPDDVPLTDTGFDNMNYTDAVKIVSTEFENSNTTPIFKFAMKLLMRDNVYRLLNPRLQHHRNSCYISTVIVALFLQPCKFITENILLYDRIKHRRITKPLNSYNNNASAEIKSFDNIESVTNELRKLVFNMRSLHPPNSYHKFNNYNIEELRLKMIKAGVGIVGHEMESCTNFFVKLMNLYSISLNQRHTIFSTYKSKRNETREEIERAIPSINLDLQMIENYCYTYNTKTLDISKAYTEKQILNMEDDPTIDLKEKIEEFKFTDDVDFLMLDCGLFVESLSNYGGNRRSNYKITASSSLKEYPDLLLTTVIGYYGRHYTCIYFNRDDRLWYYFNDVLGYPKVIDQRYKNKYINDFGIYFFYQKD